MQTCLRGTDQSCSYNASFAWCSSLALQKREGWGVYVNTWFLQDWNMSSTPPPHLKIWCQNVSPLPPTTIPLSTCFPAPPPPAFILVKSQFVQLQHSSVWSCRVELACPLLLIHTMQKSLLSLHYRRHLPAIFTFFTQCRMLLAFVVTLERAPAP